MADLIQQLPDSIANQIAAGEVVQRPASVVKELMENSVDAGSSRIQLIIRNAGKSLIQVIDNGCGMSETDARMSFERHATSKIRSAEDLFSVRTMGFRGEALASIAAVAQVELKTKKAGDELGSLLVIHGSGVLEQKYCQSSQGTSISVENLFFNTPGRRRFLKSDAAEYKHIREEFIRLALAHPDIEFILHKDDHLAYHLKPSALRQRIVALFGEEINKKLIPIAEESGDLKIDGFIGKPEFSKKSRREQYLFVNDRFVKNYYIAHAVQSAFKDLIEEDKYPFFVLFLYLDPESLDINVHPTKHEIKFEDERLVYQMVQVTVKHALGKHQVAPSLDFESDNRFMQSLQGNKSASGDSGSWNTKPGKGGYESSNLQHWQNLYEGLQSKEEMPKETPTQWTEMQRQKENHRAGACLQVQGSYIVAAIASGVVVIDQQAAHERILYERILKMRQSGEISSQRLLFPVLLDLSRQEFEELSQYLDEINALGFDIQPFGDNSLVVHAQPAYTQLQMDHEQTIRDLLGQKDMDKDMELNLSDRMARNIAIHSAVKKGQYLTEEQMQDLIEELFSCTQANYGLRKQRTHQIFDLNNIEGWFKK
ncbi:MAG TPA: DNA mismatch repair endonuclease MutL [Saprospiraceae bacterium]|nr:DNA mismatch repair endonuclease MutL [Saprospiraceae bacterium]